MKNLFFLTIIILLSSCSNNDIEETTLQKVDNINPRLVITDSIKIPIKVEGFNEYIPVEISKSEDFMIFFTSRAAKLVYIYDFNEKRIHSINVENFLLKKLKYGINCVGFLSNNKLALFVDNKFLVIDFIKKELIKNVILPKESYSSYNKRLVPYYLDNDTLMISQFISNNLKNNEYNDSSDAVIDKPVLTIYSVSKNTFKKIYLPASSRFKEENLGLNVSRFFLDGELLKFVVSPENKVYQTSMNLKNFDVQKTTNFQYMTNDTVFGFPRDNAPKDIIKLSNINPHITDILKYKNYTIISYIDGMTNKEYSRLHSRNIFEKERNDLYVDAKRSHYMIFDEDNLLQYNGEKLDKKIRSISLKFKDSSFVLMPNNAYYFKEDTIPIFIAKLKL